jgi:hypothetical protein
MLQAGGMRGTAIEVEGGIQPLPLETVDQVSAKKNK